MPRHECPIEHLSPAAFPGFELVLVHWLEEIGNRSDLAFQEAHLESLARDRDEPNKGLLPLAMTTSSPSTAASIRRERWVLAAWMVNCCMTWIVQHAHSGYQHPQISQLD